MPSDGGIRDVAVYDVIGSGYDRTRQADPYLAERLTSLLRAKPAGIYLDVGCGTANYSAKLAERNVRCCGVDVSSSMLTLARTKYGEAQVVRGDAHRLPFAEGTFAGAFCFLSLHHFQDLAGAFDEIRRVLNGGRLVLFTSTSEQMRAYWLNHYFPLAMERSRAQMPALDRIVSALNAAGLKLAEQERYFVRPDLQDRFLYSAKEQPQLYLADRFRAGISTFRLFSDANEISRGCSILENDLRTGRFRQIVEEYDDSAGDYLFLSAEAR